MSSGIFQGIETGLRSLRVHQQALNVTAHNIANSAAPGYTRQQALLQATTPITIPGVGQIGTGVTIYSISRTRDSFLDGQLRHESSSSHMYSAMKRGLDEIQSFINEPSDNGLRTVMQAFWSAFQEVANNPESDASRRTAIQAGVTLADAVSHMHRQFTDLRSDLTINIEQKVSEMNAIVSQIQSLNEQIRNTSAIPNQQPNDLKDQRDLLIDKLSGIAKVSVTEDTHQMVTVSIGGVDVVSGLQAHQAVYTEDAGGPHITINGTDIIGAPGGVALRGALGGMFDLRDRIIGDYVSYLDTLARTVITETNALHRQGWGLQDATHVERDFFEGTGASDISVVTLLQQDPSKLAASSNGLPGDGSIALQIARLKQSLVMSGGTATFDDYYRGVVGKLGVQADETNRYVVNQDLLIKDIETHRQQVMGVSVDEEMANMVRFQHAYTAAARLITTFDEMLETVVSRMGVTGR